MPHASLQAPVFRVGKTPVWVAFLVLGIVASVPAADPVSIDAAKVVTKLYDELPEMHTVSTTITLERNDTAFQWLEYEVRALAKQGMAVEFSVERKPRPRSLSECANLSPTSSHILIHASMLHEVPDWQTVRQFEMCWYAVLHEMENAFQQEKFAALAKKAAEGTLTRDQYADAMIGYEMESMSRATKKYRQLREHYFTGMGVDLKHVKSTYESSANWDRKALIALYAGGDLGTYYREAYDLIQKSVPRAR